MDRVLALGRVGCYSVGEHFGRVSDFFLATRYDGGEVREPTLGDTPLLPGTTFHTPGGRMPSISSASRSAESGACSGGLSTTVLPAASGAPDLPAANMNGWLNGMMRPTTPSGSRTEKFTTSGPIGIEATNDIEALFALRPDVVVYNPMWLSVDELVRILEPGIDVVTTAATVQECASVLKLAGAREVSVWAVARAPEPA